MLFPFVAFGRGAQRTDVHTHILQNGATSTAFSLSLETWPGATECSPTGVEVFTQIFQTDTPRRPLRKQEDRKPVAPKKPQLLERTTDIGLAGAARFKNPQRHQSDSEPTVYAATTRYARLSEKHQPRQPPSMANSPNPESLIVKYTNSV